uniref:NADH-cytochrome b5 reductase n=1 Tax=Macrocybe gigantea TaxID=1491104 RepID=A0A2K8JND1_MACGN|nr:NADH-cytochrome b5 reductase [Macrocybe gigantea]
MPNRLQFAFLASFIFTFTFLVLLSRFINARLIAAGYDFSQLILIGLSKEGTTSDRVEMPQFSLPFFGNVDLEKVPSQLVDAAKNFKVDDLRAVEVPLLGTYDFVEIASSPAVVITAVIVVATAFYAKVLHTGRSKPLNPKAWQEYPLEKKIQVSHNTAIYRFKLPHAQDVLGLPVGQHISIAAEINGKEIVRSYTPISNDDDRGAFDLLIKSYEKGNISRYVAGLKIGQTIRVKGPKGNFQYAPGLCSHLSMIAGGTGITPMIQIIRAVLRNPFDPTTVTLIYANVNEDDILLKDDIEELLDVHEAKFKVHYVLNNPPPGWKGGVGFVTREHIKEHLPNPNSTDSKILICGPPPMVSAMKKNLEELKYPVPRTISKLADKVFVF